jgi:hypothetical protein
MNPACLRRRRTTKTRTRTRGREDTKEDDEVNGC